MDLKPLIIYVLLKTQGFGLYLWSLTGQVKNSFFVVFVFFVGVEFVKLKIRTYVALKNVSSFFHMIKHAAT